MRGPVLAVALALPLLLAGCGREMAKQPRYDPYEAAALFPDGKVMQAPPEGTVARGDLLRTAALTERPPMSLALLQRGRERFEIFCTPCHSRLGDGEGVVPQRGFPHPPSFHDPRLREAPSSYFVRVITEGHGAMYSYAARVPPPDRWAIAAYIRALQLSQNVPLALLPQELRAGIEAKLP